MLSWASHVVTEALLLLHSQAISWTESGGSRTSITVHRGCQCHRWRLKLTMPWFWPPYVIHSYPQIWNLFPLYNVKMEFTDKFYKVFNTLLMYLNFILYTHLLMQYFQRIWEEEISLALVRKHFLNSCYMENPLLRIDIGEFWYHFLLSGKICIGYVALSNWNAH